MKLIIDIDDEMVCNDIKSKALEPTSATDKVIIHALYNCKPYDKVIDEVTELLENEWGYEGMRDDVARIMEGVMKNDTFN